MLRKYLATISSNWIRDKSFRFEYSNNRIFEYFPIIEVRLFFQIIEIIEAIIWPKLGLKTRPKCSIWRQNWLNFCEIIRQNSVCCVFNQNSIIFICLYRRCLWISIKKSNHLFFYHVRLWLEFAILASTLFWLGFIIPVGISITDLD